MKKKTPVILLVDDDAFLRGVYGQQFEMEGYRVIYAANGEEALKQVKKKKPDAIVLDILMPVMDGFACLEALKANPKTARIPVVMCSSLAEKHAIDRAMKLGALGYIIKQHVRPSELVVQVRHFLDSSHHF